MADDYKIEKIEKLSKSVQAFKRFVDRQSPTGIPTDRQYFDSLMRQEKGVTRVADNHVDAAKKVESRPSLMDEVARANRKIESNTKDGAYNLVAQTQDASTRIDMLRRELDKGNIELKGSVERLLKGKLTDISEHLKVALAKAGIEYEPPLTTGRVNPARKFLDYLAFGQDQLEKLTDHVEHMAASKKEIQPSDLLAMQIKVGHVQAELEFFSGLLNKALESTKTIMNVQV